MGRLSSLLNQPEYVHTAINHFPLIGLMVALMALAVGLITRNRPVLLTGLGLVAATAISIWPVYSYGEAGFDRVLSMSDEAGEAFLKYHAELAYHWAFLYYLTAAAAAVGLGLCRKWPRALIPAGLAALVLGLASLSAGVAIARAGGEVRHREFRSGPPPASRAGNPTVVIRTKEARAFAVDLEPTER
jgi:hypothetical protein